MRKGRWDSDFEVTHILLPINISEQQFSNENFDLFNMNKTLP